jgi:hypothetical protein
MRDGLVPVRDRMRRSVRTWERLQGPNIITLICVTRSALRELQEHAVGMRKVQVGEAEIRKARAGIPDGPSIENN